MLYLNLNDTANQLIRNHSSLKF